MEPYATAIKSAGRDNPMHPFAYSPMPTMTEKSLKLSTHQELVNLSAPKNGKK